MDTNTYTKIIKNINFDLAQKINLSIADELGFVLLNIQNDIYFVGIGKNSDKMRIREYLQNVVGNNINFIPFEERFDPLFEYFCGQMNARFGINYTPRKKTAANNSDDLSGDDIGEDDLNITDDDLSFDIQIDEGDDSQDILDEGDNDINDSNEDSFMTSDDDQSSQDDEADMEINTSKNIPAQEKKSADINQVKAPQTKKLGEILIEEKLITKDQLNIALAESKAQKLPLGATLVKLGYIKIKDLKEALGAQLGLDFATSEQLQSLPIETSVFPEDFIRLNKVIPLSMSDKKLVVGMVNPSDTKVINEIVFQTGYKPEVKLVTHAEFDNFLTTYFSKDKEETENLYKQIEEDNQMLDQSNLQEDAAKETEDSDGTVAQLAQKIISMAVERRASDIHIEPLSVGYRVRFRIDGSLHEILKVPAKVDSALLSRYKVLSRMNIAEHRRAQDGSFTVKFNGRPQDFRVNTLPVAGREKMVIRVLAPQMDSKQAKANKIEIVGASEEDIKKINFLVSCPNGIVLTSGPTGSGKTTTLYAILRYINSDDVNITTIEDPVEIKLEGINQSSVNTKAGITFANSLRAILRQDPDTILIGEIRDYETLEVAISASLTGHLVLSTIHTNSAAATITRLIEMGAKDYLISSTLAGVVAQRLVKRLCPNCKEEYYPTEEEAKQILTDPEEIRKLTQTKLYRPKGCSSCRNTGYLGRLAVLEIMVLNNDIRKMIAQRAHDVEIEEYAVSHGMKTLRMSCLRHILDGETSIEEQVRILGLAGDE